MRSGGTNPLIRHLLPNHTEVYRYAMDGQQHDSKEEIDIRHHLSLDRTVMANERTFLAYSRTALALVVSGMGFIQFSNMLILKFISILFIPVGIFTFVFGILRFHKKKKSINEQRKRMQL